MTESKHPGKRSRKKSGYDGILPRELGGDGKEGLIPANSQKMSRFHTVVRENSAKEDQNRQKQWRRKGVHEVKA